MYEDNVMTDFFRIQLLTIILTIYGLFYADNSSYLLCVAGLLMIIFTVENLSEERNIFIEILKIFFITLCCIISKGFLIFILYGKLEYKKMGVMFPSIFFLIYKFIINRNTFFDILPVTIVQIAVLMGFSLIIWYVKKLLDKYIEYRNQITASMCKSAVNEMTERKLNRVLLAQSNIIERNARLEERENISRNIHNSVGHTITAASMALDAASVLWEVSPDKAIDKVNTANERIQTGLESIRHAVRVLDAEAENISIDDFKLELEAIIDNFTMDTDIKVYFDFEILSKDVQIPHEHTEFMTGAVEELLTNGVRHGNADCFTLCLLADSSHIKVTVTDNGKSDFDGKNSVLRIEEGFGLKKIIKYIEKTGGSTEFKNENGFRAEMTIPLE